MIYVCIGSSTKNSIGSTSKSNSKSIPIFTPKPDFGRKIRKSSSNS